MTRVGGGSQLFQVDYSIEYAAVQAQFNAVVATGDPHLLVDFLQRCPYHLEGYLRLSEYHTLHGQHEAAAVALRHALFLIEAAWHPSFRPWELACRLVPPVGGGGADGEHGTDHVWKAWRAAAFAAARAGASRAAFSFSVLLLQLCPTGPRADPLRTLLAIDYFALAPNEPVATDWLLRLTGGEGGGSSGDERGSSAPMLTLRGSVAPAALLPNLALSRALALFAVEAASWAAHRGSHSASAGRGEEDVGVARRGATATASTAAAVAMTTAVVAPPAAPSPPHLQPQPPPPPPTPSASPLLCADLSFVAYNATRSLVRALLLYPHVLLPLLGAVGITKSTVGVGAVGAGGGQQAAGAGGAPYDARRHHPMCTRSEDCRWAPLFAAPLFSRAALSFSRCGGGGGGSTNFHDGADDDDDEEDEEEDGGGARGTGRGHVTWSASGTQCTPQLEKLIRCILVRQVSLWRGAPALSWLHAAASVAAAARACAAVRTPCARAAPPRG